MIRKKVILGAESYDSPVWGKAPGCALLGCCQWLSPQNELAADPAELNDKEPEGTSPESDGPGESNTVNISSK